MIMIIAWKLFIQREVFFHHVGAERISRLDHVSRLVRLAVIGIADDNIWKFLRETRCDEGSRVRKA